MYGVFRVELEERRARIECEAAEENEDEVHWNTIHYVTVQHTIHFYVIVVVVVVVVVVSHIQRIGCQPEKN